VVNKKGNILLPIIVLLALLFSLVFGYLVLKYMIPSPLDPPMVPPKESADLIAKWKTITIPGKLTFKVPTGWGIVTNMMTGEPQFITEDTTLEAGSAFYIVEPGNPTQGGEQIFVDFNANKADRVRKNGASPYYDQILSTFKFIDDTNKTVSPICNLKNANYGFKVAGYYKCNGYNLLIPDQIILDLPAIIVDDNANDILTCGGMPGPNGPNTCPEKYQRNESCKKIDCP
jgi:hypothetical protein